MERLKSLKNDDGDFFHAKNLRKLFFQKGMPLYEGIGLISEKHAVVVDLGSATTKCGYAGEVSPRCVIPSKVGNTWIHSVTDKEKLHALLVEFVHQLYFKWLLVNPKDRRVVIVENLLGSSVLKEVLAAVLFRHYEVSSVLFVPSHLVALFTLGVNTGELFSLVFRPISQITFKVLSSTLDTRKPP